MFACCGHRELLLMKILCIQGLWHLSHTAENHSHEKVLSGISTEPEVLQSTDENDLRGFFTFLTSQCLLLLTYACETQTVNPSPKMILKKRKISHFSMKEAHVLTTFFCKILSMI